MTRNRSNLLGLCCLVCTVCLLVWKAQHAEPETFRGQVEPYDGSAEAYAERLVRSVEAVRGSGIEPSRDLFELPEGWTPPKGWQPPEGWEPPSWWP